MYKKIVLIIALSVLFSCKQNNQDNANLQLVKTYFEHFNKHEWAKMAAMYAEDAEFKDPTFGKNIVKQSRKQIIEKYTELNKIFPDLNDEIIQVYPSGNNNIIVEFVSTGTAPDNSKFELPICTILKIENGLIIKDFTYFDNFEEEK